MLILSNAALLFAAVIGTPSALPSRPGPETTPAKVSVRQVMTMQALAGETVSVSGRCLGRDAEPIALGSRPLAGVWQLEDNGVAIWVVGDMPKSCASGQATVTGRVEQDLVPKFGPPRALRQYLVIR